MASGVPAILPQGDAPGAAPRGAATAPVAHRGLLLLTLAFVFVVALSSQTYFDFWWYLKSGELILRSGRVPDTDPFSFTAEGRPWVNHMWLTQVLLSAAYERLGRVPILLGKSLLVTATFALVLRTALARGAHPLAAAGLTALAALAGEPYWHARPQVITYFLLAVLLHLLRPGWEARPWRLLVVPLLTVPWANLHAGFVAGLGLLGVLLGAEAARRLLGPAPGGWRPVGWLALATAGAAVASLANPFGVRALLFPAEVVASREFMTTTVEWFSPNFHDPRHRPFELLLLLGFAALGLGARPGLRDTVVLGVFTLLGLRSIRHIPLYAVAVTPVLAVAVTEAGRHLWAARGPAVDRALAGAARRLPTLWPILRSPLVPAGALGLVLAALLAGYAVRVADPRTGALAQDLNEARYPVAALAFMRRERVPAPIFNLYLWGGYELWRLYPDYRVFFDGRTHVYGEGIVRDYLTVAMAHPDWRQVLDRWGVQTVLTSPGSPLTQVLEASRDWRLVFVEREALVFVRDAPAHRALFARLGPVERPTPPWVVRTALEAGVRAMGRGDAAGAERRFRQALALDAGNPVALYNLGLLLAGRGERGEAERLWREVQRRAPGSPLARLAEQALAGQGPDRR